MRLALHRAFIARFSAAALTAAGCADQSVNPVGPSASADIASLAASATFPRSGDLRVTKECSAYTGAAGDVCTITSSNIREIAVGSRVVYARAADFSTMTIDSDVVLDLPAPGSNAASGHCQVSLVTGAGRCTFSGGTGTFTHFRGNANVSYLGGPSFAWDGTYSFGPRD